MKIKGLIFDLDGVLVDTKKIHFNALNSALKSINFEEITFKDHVNIYDGLPTLEKLKLLTEKKGLPANKYEQIWQQKQENRDIKDKPKISISMREGIKMALSTPHILYLTTCIISFSILCNVYENAVRNIILNHYGTEQEVFRFWGTFFFGKGLLVITANIVSKALLKRVGWFYVAITTPIISIISIHVILSIPSFQIDPHVMANTRNILWGLAILLQLNFAVKYAFFDPTKEMAYIPLNHDQRTYGKTVADGMGSRIGNISSGMVQSIAIMVAAGNDFTQIAPILLGICSIISIGWIWAITGLSKTYNQMTSEKNTPPLSLVKEKT